MQYVFWNYFIFILDFSTRDGQLHNINDFDVLSFQLQKQFKQMVCKALKVSV